MAARVDGIVPVMSQRDKLRTFSADNFDHVGGILPTNKLPWRSRCAVRMIEAERNM